MTDHEHHDHDHHDHDRTATFPFSAVVGHDDVKLALLLATIEPALGGVLLRGEKGSAKTTLARGLAGLLGGAPFVELPLGATEDRVLGSIDLATLLAAGEVRFRPGLLAQADGGVLYVDEINLLADHLVDALLDVAVSGLNRVEREGVSHEHPARFVLVGSMNPEEGELRPQLLDRFGLAADVHSSRDVAERAAAVGRRLAFDRDPQSVEAFVVEDVELRDRLASCTTASVPTDLIALASRVALEVGAEGLRADLMLCRAASASAGLEGRTHATGDDLRRAAPFVLAHRRRRSPFDEPGITPGELDDAFERACRPPPELDDPADPAGPSDAAERASEPPRDGQVTEPAAEVAPPALTTRTASPASGRRSPATGDRGRFVRSAPASSPEVTSLALNATAAAVSTRRATEPEAGPTWRDLHEATREQRAGNLIVLAVDASGSMGAQQRMATAKAAALGLLTDAYQRRDRVALVAFGGEGAEVILRPTGSIEVARGRLADLATGGATPLAEGLDVASDLAVRTAGEHGLDPMIVVITDGRATGRADAGERVQKAAAHIRTAKIPCVVIDAETELPRLGLAERLAEQLAAPALPLRALAAGELGSVLRSQISRS